MALTLEDWITSSDQYPERSRSPELTQEVKASASVLLTKVNRLLDQVGIKNTKVSSGFRPSTINSKIPNAAKRSAHMTGLALDLNDPDGLLKKLIVHESGLLRSLGLFVENPASTPYWIHIDYVSRADRESRIFQP